MGRQRVFQARSPRRLTDWGAGVNAGGVGAAATGKFLWTTSLSVSSPFTMIRLRGYAHITLASSAAVGDGFTGAIGVALVNTDAFLAGAGSIPGPFTDQNWDGWFYHHFFDVRSITATIADGANASAASQRIVIDSKAMRKWDPSETMVGMFEVSESGAASIELNAQTRVLLKV